MNNRTTYRPRLITDSLDAALQTSPVVVLTGARQTGKSTLVQHLPRHARRTYITLDDIETLHLANTNPESLFPSDVPCTLDEVQRSPSLLLAIKRAVDKRRRPGQFLLTGSANLLMMKRMSESLAGRAVYLTLLPLTHAEERGKGAAGAWHEFFNLPSAKWLERFGSNTGKAADWKRLAVAGGYPTPALHLKTREQQELWFAGYARTYLERDIQDLGGVASPVDLRRLMRALCLRIGNVMNQSEIARDIGLSQPTVHRHLDILETSHQLVRLSPYAVNRTKRLIKSPKAYWTDSGLAMYLAGERDPRGAHLENLVLTDLLSWQTARSGPEIMYWRSVTGEEVDIVVEWNGKLLPVEVKSAHTPRISDARHLLTFREQYKRASLPGLLIHTGTECRWLLDGIFALPWWKIM